MKKILLLAILASVPQPVTQLQAQMAQPIPRTILSCYDSRTSEDAFYSLGHQMAELPLNHLGLMVQHLNVNDPLPDPETLEHIRGVLMWLESGEMQDPAGFLDWAEELVRRDKKFVILGDFAFNSDLQGQPTEQEKINRFMALIGLQVEFDWTPVTYEIEITSQDLQVMGFERRLAGVFEPFEQVRAIDPAARVLLQVRRRNAPDTTSDLVVATPNGGYAALGYTHYVDSRRNRKQWILNPFEFFRLAFGADRVPKPDTTTLSGRRLYYSHVDGDGWRNLSEIPSYRKNRVLSAEVILKEIFTAFPDLPVTVAPVAGDLHPDWFGTEESRQIAQQIFALPHVEIGSHTFSHPFEWSFFADGDAHKEKPYLNRYTKHWGQPSAISWLTTLLAQGSRNGHQIDTSLGEEELSTPRAYAVKPFDIEREIGGSIGYIETLAPEGKRLELVQWSGDTRPFRRALEAVRELERANINGGDTRFDREFHSVGWVAPVGLAVGDQYQIYASNSNENTYTDLWRDRYFGFVHLVRTFQNTELPRRLKPLNVYYHMYSGEKLSSLNALLSNLTYVRSQSICPITASHYSRIAEGFRSALFEDLGDARWRVSRRGRLQTLRFDRASQKTVDLERSVGVVGQRHLHGSLYVALDRSHQEPVVALRELSFSHTDPAATRPYLIESGWDVWNLRVSPSGFDFSTAGFGPLESRWKVPLEGDYEVRISGGKQPILLRAVVGPTRTLAFRFEQLELGPLEVSIRHM